MLARILKIIALCLTLDVLVGALPVAAADISNVRIGKHPTMTRMVVELDAKISYRVFTLANPYRVVVDMPQVDWKLEDAASEKAGHGVISNYRFGLFQPGNSRLVIDTEQPVKLVKHVLIPPKAGHPYRLVFDLQVVSAAEFDSSERQFASVGWVDPPSRAATARPKAPASKARPKGLGPQKRIVVLDPGHGGPDPGALGVSGIREKKITLKVAQAVKHILEQTGRYRVYLTRNEDIFVPLRRRYQLAEEAGSELFISLHADSNNDPKVRGASIYTLSEKSSDREAAALAAKENRSDAIAGVDLSNQSDAVASFLIDLRQRQTMNESALFSEALIREVSSNSRLLRNSHRFAGFAVLKSPDVPSVLIELGYLSNRQDEKLLRSSRYHRKIGRAILRATDAFFERKERLSRS